MLHQEAGSACIAPRQGPWGEGPLLSRMYSVAGAELFSRMEGGGAL
jgi:hypothetical protein